jgi:GH43 family beta-xylosidase
MKLLAFLLVTLSAFGQTTFHNPLLSSGPDPWIARDRDFYYMTVSTGTNLVIRKSLSLAGLSGAEPVVVWEPPATGSDSKELWAPELHRIDGQWYLYYSADDGENSDHRVYVLENGDPDPTSLHWIDKGRLTTDDHWAIDATVFELGHALYAVWSGWPGSVDGTQNLYISRMKSPWEASGPRVLISTPEHAWEKFGDIKTKDGVRHVNVNEGPEVLQHDGQVFLTYSASGCWTDHYALGMLVLAKGGDPMKRESWTKDDEPVFQGSPAAHAFGTGHNGFFTSPDGRQSWIVYHANPEANQGCGALRSPRAQPFTWNEDGTPDFGKPIPLSAPIAVPKGDPTHP